MNVYDFDGTVYKGDSSIDFYLFCIKRHPSILRFLPHQIYGFFSYKLNKIPKTQFKEYYFKFLQGMDDVDALVKSFWDIHLNRICEWYKKIYCEDDLIISASPDFLLCDICQRLNIALISSNVDKHTGVFYKENCFGEEKVKRFYEFYGRDASVDNFYSDSLSDLPLARIAKNAFLIKDGHPTKWII